MPGFLAKISATCAFLAVMLHHYAHVNDSGWLTLASYAVAAYAFMYAFFAVEAKNAPEHP